jgi:hypothetical protein
MKFGVRLFVTCEKRYTTQKQIKKAYQMPHAPRRGEEGSGVEWGGSGVDWSGLVLLCIISFFSFNFMCVMKLGEGD